MMEYIQCVQTTLMLSAVVTFLHANGFPIHIYFQLISK